MKFAFIENRYKTFFWAEVANKLSALGHRTIWLVQNPVFAPSDDDVSIIPFPRGSEFSKNDGLIPDSLVPVRNGDRFINYFGGHDRHYSYYHGAIKHWLDHKQPDVVVGECTLFHELLVIEECRSRGIPFLHPSMPGYPGGRYSVYAYDTKEPLGKSTDIPDDVACLELAEAIRKREKIPDYMTSSPDRDPERSYPLPGSFQDRISVLSGYLRGERFNTPAPWRKWWLNRQVKRNTEFWKRIVKAKTAPVGMRYVLYPMQMQPEANLDVWGQEFRDQASFVRELGDALPDGWHLLVKANPKFKYEVSEELFDVIAKHPRVSPLSLSEPMSSILDRIDLVATITGTVAVECALSKKPVVQFGPGIVEHGCGCIQLGDTGEIANVVRSIELGNFDVATDLERVRLVQRLYRTTFPGIVSDPMSSPAVMAEDNVRSVANVLVEVGAKCV